MEAGYRFAICLQVLLGWILRPVYWVRSRKEKKAIPPIDDPILLLSATALSAKIRKRQMSCVQVVTAYIERVKAVNPLVNAVVEDRFEEALKDARGVDEFLAGNVLKEADIKTTRPLLGVPLTVKESCSLKGLSNCVGSTKRLGMKATEDGEAVRKLKMAGAIPLLVSNTPELCFGWESNNLVTGKTCNPYDTNLTSGGSSGGEGALLASGASVIGVGSELAGSIRLPAMFNGVFGHKPTPRVISIEGHYPSCKDERLLDYLGIGPMTRFAEDLKVMTEVMAGENASSLRLDEFVDLSRVNVFFMETASGSFKVSCRVDEDVRLVMRECVDHLSEGCGCKVIDFKFDMEDTCEMGAALLYDLRDIPNILQDPVNGEHKGNLYVELAKRMFGKSEYSLNGLFWLLLQNTNLLIPKSKCRYYQTRADKLKHVFLQRLDDNGIFLYPTFPSCAFQHNEIFTLTSGVMYTMIFNVLGFPCTHVPLGRNNSGVPIGIQVVAAPYQDRLCFAIAQELEKRFGGWIEPSQMH